MSWLYLYAFLFIFSSISFLSPSALPYKYNCCSAGCPYNFAGPSLPADVWPHYFQHFQPAAQPALAAFFPKNENSGQFVQNLIN